MKNSILTTFLLLCSFLKANSQDITPCRKMRIANNDSIVEFSYTPISNTLIKLRANRYYYWYSNSKIFVTNEGVYGNIIDGDYFVFYPTGQLKCHGFIKKGLKHGYWRQWSTDGKLSSKVKYRNGKLVKPFWRLHKHESKR